MHIYDPYIYSRMTHTNRPNDNFYCICFIPIIFLINKNEVLRIPISVDLSEGGQVVPSSV